VAALYAIPAALVLAAAIALAAGAACACQTALHRRFKEEDFLPHNDVAGFMIAVVGTLYAVVLGFVTVIVWQQYDSTKEQLALEAAALTDTWHASVGFPIPVRSHIRHDMMAYAETMIRDEWPMMREGHFSTRGDELIMDAIQTSGTFVPRDGAQTNAQATTLHLLTELHDARLRRLATNEGGITWFEWAILVVGAIVVLTFCYLFGLRNRRMHLIMTGGVAVLIASMFVMIFELQYPFRGDLGIRSDAWVAAVRHMRYMDSMPMPSMHMTM
jgi:hypothetical protein